MIKDNKIKELTLKWGGSDSKGEIRLFKIGISATKERVV